MLARDPDSAWAPPDPTRPATRLLRVDDVAVMKHVRTTVEGKVVVLGPTPV